LQAMRATGMVPKLGSLCRWIRDCDAASGLDDPLVCSVVDAILRTADPSMVPVAASQRLSGVRYAPPWSIRAAAAAAAAAAPGEPGEPGVSGRGINDEVVQSRESTGGERGRVAGVDEAVGSVAEAAKQFRVVLHTAAVDRQPPNKHGKILNHAKPPLAGHNPIRSCCGLSDGGATASQTCTSTPTRPARWFYQTPRRCSDTRFRACPARSFSLTC
jgi:hypothetical protein